MSFFIVDGHEDIAMALLEHEGRVFGAPPPAGQALSLDDAKRGGLGLILATIFAPDGYWSGRSAAQAAAQQLRLYEEILLRYERSLFRVESRGDLPLCIAGGPIGLVHLLEGADPIRGPEDVPRWVDHGVRVVGIAWNTPNRYCGGTRDGGGLTPAGRDLLEALRAESVVPDLSHLNPRAVDDILAADDQIVVASHSNAHAVRAHERNLRDEHIRALAARGGVVGVVLYGPFLAEGSVTIDDVVAHVDHVVSLVGPAHVGLGSDLDGGFGTDQTPEGIDSVADLPRIGDALLARGYAESDVAAILGDNWLRVLHEVLPE